MQIVQLARRADDLARAPELHAMLLGRPPTSTYGPPGLVGQRALTP